MTNNELATYFTNNTDIDKVEVSGDGKHYQLDLVSDIFEGKTKVARQQWVYKQVKELIASGQVHALSMHTWTKTEWEQKKHG